MKMKEKEKRIDIYLRIISGKIYSKDIQDLMTVSIKTS